MEEKWKVCVVNNNYEVSNKGNVRSLKNTYIHKSSKDNDVLSKKKIKNLGGKKLSKKGYRRVNLDKITYFIHVLVAKTWIENPENKPQINHINGIKTDNRSENLEWVTNQENRDHAVKTGLQFSKFNINDMRIIQNLNSQDKFKYNYNFLAKMFNCNRETIGRIVRNELKILTKD